MAEPQKSTRPEDVSLLQHLFAGLTGLFFGLGLLKLGTPVILDDKVAVPATFEEAIYQVWPVSWGYVVLGLLAVTALPVARWKVGKPRWPFALLTLWLAWQFVAAANTVEVTLTAATLKHFCASCLCFFIGYFALSQVKDLRLLQILTLFGFILVLRVGLDQHFGGFERTRAYFFTYIYPTLTDPSPDYLKKISSDRIFSTLFYPNTFAGAILLFLPIAAFSGWKMTNRFGVLPQVAILSLITLPSLACLYWSGSKSGWLILMGLGLGLMLRTALPRSLKTGLVCLVFVLGIAGFTLKYSAFFKKGATSVAARFDYWSAAMTIFKAHPILGTGPGTFSKPYETIKLPESEMARLVHNDYLEQACDSGLVGFLAFTGMIGGSLIYLYRYRIPAGLNWEFMTWLGVLGAAAQSLSEFNFYIPALAWPTFVFLGLLWAQPAITAEKPCGRSLATPSKKR